MWGNMELRRREVQDRANAGRHDAIDDRLRVVGRNSEDRDQCFVPRDVAFEVGHVTHRCLAPELPYFGRAVVVDACDREPAILEAVIIGEGGADLSRADDDHTPFATEPENLAQSGGELMHRVPQSALAERPEGRQVFSHLGGRGTKERGKLVAGSSFLATGIELLQVAEVHRKPANRGVGYAFHEELGACENLHKVRPGTRDLLGSGHHYLPSHMHPLRHQWHRAVAAEHEPTTLSGRAAKLLADGPLDPLNLMREVCHVERLTSDAADRMAVALLGERPEFVRLSDGSWALRADPRVLPSPERVASTPFAAHRAAGVSDDVAVHDGGAEYRAISDADPLLSTLSFAVVDCETTGTNARAHDRITEISVVRVVDGAITDVYTRLVNPERPIPAFISALTQITWDMVKDEQPFRHIASDVVDRLTGHVFTAHNAPFDWGFVTAEISRNAGRSLNGPRLCTVRLSRVLLPELSRRSLDHVTRHFGIEVSARHRAEGDAIATAHVLLRLLGVAEERGLTTWSGLMSLVGPMEKRTRTASERRRRAFPHPVTKDDVA
jgi:DNA polymerase-3 subunit epsilon